MITEKTDDLPIKSIENILRVTSTASKKQISEMVDKIIFLYDRIPVRYHGLIHLANTSKRTPAVPDDIRMTKMMIACDESTHDGTNWNPD